MTAVHEHQDPRLVSLRGVISHMRESSFPTNEARLQAGLQIKCGGRVRLFFGEGVSPDALESFEEIFYNYSDEIERSIMQTSVSVVGEFHHGEDGILDTTAVFVVELELD